MWFSGTSCRLAAPKWTGVKAITLFTPASQNFTTRSVAVQVWHWDNNAVLLITASFVLLSELFHPAVGFASLLLKLTLRCFAAVYDNFPAVASCVAYTQSTRSAIISVASRAVSASPPHGFSLFVIPDQQHTVFCSAADLNVLVPPICHAFQQRDLPHLDPAGCGRWVSLQSLMSSNTLKHRHGRGSWNVLRPLEILSCCFFWAFTCIDLAT